MVDWGSHTCLYCCVKSSRNRWIMGSHESIYELLGTYMKESERYSLAPITELGEGGKKNQKNAWIPWASPEKQAGLRWGKYKSLGPRVANWVHCQKGTTLADTQQSPVIPKTCGSCKNNPCPPHPHNPPHHHHMNPHLSPVTLPNWQGARDVFFPEGVPHRYDVFVSRDMCLSVCTSQTGAVHYSGVKVHTILLQLVLI